MKRIFLLSILLLEGIIVFSQISGLYSFKLNDDIRCRIIFYEDNKYYIELVDEVYPDHYDGTLISRGTFHIYNNNIELTDKFHNYKMTLFRKDEELIVKSGIKGLIDKHFIYRGTLKSFGTFIPKDKILNINKEREDYKQLNKELFPFESGLYTAPSWANLSFDYILRIKPDNTYILYCRVIVFSEGTWTRNGNELILRDNDLNTSFYLLIAANNTFSSKLLPGYCDRCYFKRFFMIDK